MHLTPRDWPSRFDPFQRGARAVDRLVGSRLGGTLGSAYQAVRAVRERVHEGARARLIDAVSSAMASSRNRAVYLGPRAAEVAWLQAPGMMLGFLRATPERLIHEMDGAKVFGACVLPAVPHTLTDDLLERAGGSGRLFVFCAPRPADGPPGESIAAWVARGARGIKLHPPMLELAPEDPFYLQVAEAAARHDLPIVLHTGCIRMPGTGHGEFGHAERFEPLFRAVPGARWVLAHMNLFQPDVAIDLSERYENVFVDTSWQPAGVIRRALERLSARKVLFGTDWPFGGARMKIGLSILERACGGRNQAFERVASINACQLLGLPLPLGT
ncbi:MAG: amidohydrolase family protein [Planctomycetota bacterium]